MLIQTDGIVIKVNNVGEQDRLVTFLTRDLGVIRAFVRGAKSVKSKALCATSLFSYSELTVYGGSDKYIIREVQPKEVFFELRQDIEKLALAQYFAQILFELAPQEDNAEQWLRLTLNSLSFLCSGEKPRSLIKSIFELRSVTMAGYMPDILKCTSCGRQDSALMYFNINAGELHCSDCCVGGYELHMSTVVAMRYIIYSPFNKLFSFVMADSLLEELGTVCERFLLVHTGRNYNTLDFYKSLHTEGL